MKLKSQNRKVTGNKQKREPESRFFKNFIYKFSKFERKRIFQRKIRGHFFSKKLKITLRGSLRVSAAPGANYSLPKTTGDVTSRLRELLGRIFRLKHIFRGAENRTMSEACCFCWPGQTHLHARHLSGKFLKLAHTTRTKSWTHDRQVAAGERTGSKFSPGQRDAFLTRKRFQLTVSPVDGTRCRNVTWSRGTKFVTKGAPVDRTRVRKCGIDSVVIRLGAQSGSTLKPITQFKPNDGVNICCRKTGLINARFCKLKVK